MSDKKYMIVGDYLYNDSGSDPRGDYVSAPRLLELYGLPQEQCVLVDARRPQTLLGYPPLITLGPRTKGDYQEYLQARLKNK